jgi:hypothetical protein
MVLAFQGSNAVVETEGVGDQGRMQFHPQI